MIDEILYRQGILFLKIICNKLTTRRFVQLNHQLGQISQIADKIYAGQIRFIAGHECSNMRLIRAICCVVILRI